MNETTMKIDTTEMIVHMKERTDKKEEEIEMKNIEVTEATEMKEAMEEKEEEDMDMEAVVGAAGQEMELEVAARRLRAK